jgi:hypothetical protein
MRIAPPRLVAATLGILALVARPGLSAADTGGFALGPAHAAPTNIYGRCATTWDPDGGGPSPPLFVVAPNVFDLEAWDGSSFLPFGGDPHGPIRCTIVYNGQLIVGGSFQAIGGDSVTNLARWDGAHWQTLGTGLLPQGEGYYPKGSVNALVVHAGLLYVGGSLVPASTGTWNSLATWDGATLSPGRTTQAVISSLEEIGTQLYATTIPSVPGVYRYDASNWTRIGNLADTSILTLTMFNGDLICGGDFTHFFTGTNMPGVARWSGTQWVPLGTGLSPQGCEVTSLTVFNGRLIAAGAFDQAGGLTVHNVAQWDGTHWSDMDGGLHRIGSGYQNGVQALVPLNGELVAMGNFDQASNRPVGGIARWNGGTWLAFHPGVNAPVRTFDPAGSGVYAGGDFTFDWNSTSLRHVVGYDGTNVNPIAGLGSDNGVDGTVRAIDLYAIDPVTSEFVVGGAFTHAGDVAAQNVAGFAYPGGWSALGNGLDNTVLGLAAFNGSLYAAGAFTHSGGTTLNHLARFTGGNWIDPGLHSFNTLYALAVIGGRLVIGGRFGGKPFTPPDEGVTVWDGVNETLVGTADGPVYALAGFQGDIVAAGAFTSMDGVSTPSGIARRNATTGVWTPMGGAWALGVPYALAIHDNNLWVGGTIMQSASADYGRLFEWNGSTWVGTAGTLDGAVYALASVGTRLHIGGDFQRSSSGLESPYWITLNDGVLAVDPDPAPPAMTPGASVPNPTHGVSRVRFTLERAARAHVTILDVAGRQVRTLADATFEPGSHDVTWDGADDTGRSCPAGLYFYRVALGDHAFTRRVVLAR